MGTFSTFYRSTIGRKIIVGLTGLFLCSFLIIHTIGNLFLYAGDNGVSFNRFAEGMDSNLIIRILEIVLFGGFILHILYTSWIWVRNKLARPHGYTLNRPSANSSLASRTTFVTGSIIFIFLVIHLQSIWWPGRFEAVENPSMYLIVLNAFSNLAYDIFYLIALVLLGYHLRHGFQSAFQTFGLRNKKYAGLIDLVGILFWLIIPLIFASMPIYFYWYTHFGGMNTI